MKANDKIPVIVRMSEQPNLLTITQDFKGTSKQVRSTKCIKYLKNFALNKQSNIKNSLKKEKSLSHVEQYTPFWIFNGFAIRTTPKVILAIANRSNARSISLDISLPLIIGLAKQCN